MVFVIRGMVNKVVLDYFREHYEGYSMEDLKASALEGGYSQQEIDEAVVALDARIAGIKSDREAALGPGEKSAEAPEEKVVGVDGVKVEKKKVKWVKSAVISLVVFLVLGAISVGIYFYLKG